MAEIIEIRDEEGGVLTANLHQLLEIVGKKGASLVWSILDIEAVGHEEKFQGDLPEMERQAAASPQGLIFKWEELVTLAESLSDVWNLLLVAAHSHESIPRLEYSATDFGHCEIVIECFDSTYWRVYARDDEIIRRLEQSFKDVTITPVNP